MLFECRLTCSGLFVRSFYLVVVVVVGGGVRLSSLLLLIFIAAAFVFCCCRLLPLLLFYLRVFVGEKDALFALIILTFLEHHM